MASAGRFGATTIALGWIASGAMGGWWWMSGRGRCWGCKDLPMHKAFVNLRRAIGQTESHCAQLFPTPLIELPH